MDIAFFVQLGAPASAFNEDGILDVDQLIELGWTIDDNAESFNPPTDGGRDDAIRKINSERIFGQEPTRRSTSFGDTAIPQRRLLRDSECPSERVRGRCLVV